MPRKPFEGIESRGGCRTLKSGCTLQRLYSTFPNGWPGIGLLLLRLCAGIALIYFGITSLSSGTGEPIALTRNLIAVAAGIFLLAGLWTPIAGALAAVDEAWIAFSLYSLRGDGKWDHIFLAVMAASVAMLGPGAWSIDARLFGRKRFDIDRTRGGKPSL